MNLPEELIKGFSDLVSSAKKDRSDKNVYGVVTRKTDSAMFVQFDGSDIETPVDYTTDAKVGDRVLVMIKNHKATITGNVSAPVNARAGDRFMRFTEEGLRIGVLDDDGDPTGYSLLLSGDTYYVKDASGNTLASFAASQIQLLYGNGTIKVDNQTLYLLGRVAAGLRAEKPSVTPWKAEVAVKCNPDAAGWEDDDNPAAGIQVLYDGVPRASIIVNKDGCFANGVPIGKVYEQQYVLTNGTELDSVLPTHAVTLTLDAPPTGYRWEGFSGVLIDLGRKAETSPGSGVWTTVWNNNYYHDDNKYIAINHMTVYPSTRRAYVSFSAQDMFFYIGYRYVKLTLLCFALPFSSVASGEIKYISF